MKTFEISSEKGQNGRRNFKMILYRIFDDACIDEANQVGTNYNLNGITWIREYCEKALPSIKGMSLRCEFLDEDRTEICGHGMTNTVDGVPIFEDAVVIGTFSEGYIDKIEDSDGNEIIACIGVGEIDSSCYNNFCNKLDENIANGIYPSGSIEIMRTAENDGIVYKYGYKDKGRIPTEFIHSGFALLGVQPADDSARLLELNQLTQKEDIHNMNETEILALIEKTVAEMNKCTSEINQCKDECKEKCDAAAETVDKAVAEKNEAMATVEKIQSALDACQKERDEAYTKLNGLYEEMKTLREELGKAQAEKRIGEMNSAISTFTDDEKAYAKDEIAAFKADPVNVEINSVVDKILVEIGKKAKEASVASEQNSAKSATFEDIFSAVDTKTAEDTEIF